MSAIDLARRRPVAILEPSVRGFFEPRFCRNFANVRIHTDSEAGTLADQIKAKAFTVDNHIFFGRRQYQPDHASGRQLIAHELTHTVQQGQRAGHIDPGATVRRAPANSEPPALTGSSHEGTSPRLPRGVEARASLVDLGGDPKWQNPRLIAALLVQEIEFETTIQLLFDSILERLNSAELKREVAREFLDFLDNGTGGDPESSDRKLVNMLIAHPGDWAVLRSTLALAQSDSEDTTTPNKRCSTRRGQAVPEPMCSWLRSRATTPRR